MAKEPRPPKHCPWCGKRINARNIVYGETPEVHDGLAFKSFCMYYCRGCWDVLVAICKPAPTTPEDIEIDSFEGTLAYRLQNRYPGDYLR